MPGKPTYEELEQRVRELEENQIKYRTLIENMPIACFTFDKKGTILDWNPAAEQMYGYTESEAAGAGFYDLIVTSENKKAAEQEIKKVFNRESVTGSTGQDKKKNGEIVRRTGNTFPLLKADGSVDCGMILNINITDRVKAVEKLNEIEARYKGIFDYTKDGVAVYTVKGNGEDFIFSDLNRAGEKIDNTKREKLIGKSVLEMFPAVKEFGLFNVFQRVWRTGKPEHYPVALYKDDRISGWRDNYVYKLPSGEIVAVYSDETERMQAEEALKKACQEMEQKVQERTAELSEANLQLTREINQRKKKEEALELTQFAVDHSMDAVFWIGPDARFVYVNKAVCNALGYSKEKLLTMTVHDIDPIFSQDVWPARWEDLQRKKSLIIESHHRTRDGKILPVEIAANHVEFGDKEYTCAFARDISERKHAEEERERLIGELQKALDNVKTLKGLLPICASCKKVRDDKGYWEQIEDYIRNYSEVSFSHSLCPECMDKIYGEEEWYKKKREKEEK
jgi:PAS domain S-box-containing protein